MDEETLKGSKFMTRAAPDDIKRWKADAKRRGMTLSAWTRRALNEAAGRVAVVEPREVPVARTEEILGELSGGRTEETREAATGPVRALDSYARGREVARELAQKEGRCTADVTKGVRCRLCGKMH